MSNSGAARARPRVTVAAIPAHSEIARRLAKADFSDCYVVDIAATPKSALALYLEVARKTPAWVNRLMALRNRIVRLVGLKDLGAFDGALGGKQADDYKVGDRVGIFSNLYLSQDEVIMVDADKHLTVQVSACKLTDAVQQRVALSTVVHIHNRLGRIYMLFVAPAHRIIAPAVLARAT